MAFLLWDKQTKGKQLHLDMQSTHSLTYVHDFQTSDVKHWQCRLWNRYLKVEENYENNI